MSAYDYDTWEDYVKGQADELKALNIGIEFLPGKCIEKWIWDTNKRHHNMVMAAHENSTRTHVEADDAGAATGDRPTNGK